MLVFVANLGSLPPTAHVHPTSTPIPPDAAFTHIHAPEAMADVTINPGRAGRSEVTIRVLREDFSPSRQRKCGFCSTATGIRKTLDRAATSKPTEPGRLTTLHCSSRAYGPFG